MHTIDSEGFKEGTLGAPIMPRDAVSRTANVERTGRHKWVKGSGVLTNAVGDVNLFIFFKFIEMLKKEQAKLTGNIEQYIVFQLAVRSLFVFANINCDWLK